MGEDEIRLPTEYVKVTFTYFGQYLGKRTKITEKNYCSKRVTCTHKKDFDNKDRCCRLYTA